MQKLKHHWLLFHLARQHGLKPNPSYTKHLVIGALMGSVCYTVWSTLLLRHHQKKNSVCRSTWSITTLQVTQPSVRPGVYAGRPYSVWDHSLANGLQTQNSTFLSNARVANGRVGLANRLRNSLVKFQLQHHHQSTLIRQTELACAGAPGCVTV